MRNLLTTFAETLIAGLVFSVIIVLISMALKKKFRIRSGIIIAVFILLLFAARFAFSFTFYGDMGGGSYIRIPLEKPYVVLYDEDKEYAVITSQPDKFYDAPDAIHVKAFNRKGELVYGTIASPEHDFFFLNLENDSLRIMKAAAYSKACEKEGISSPLLLYTAVQYDGIYWKLFTNFFRF